MSRVGTGLRTGLGATLRTAPWRRAPLLLAGSLGVAVAVAAGAAVLAVAAASGPLFLSSTGSAALAREAAAQCPEAPLPAVTYPSRGVLFGSLNVVQDDVGLHRTDTAVRSAFVDVGLPTPFRVLTAQPPIDLPGGSTTPVTLFSRAGALDHLTVLRRTPGRGLWFSDLAAARLGLTLGDRVTVGGQTARVVGLYRDLNGPGFGHGVPRYWCSWSALILVTLESRPPPLVFTDDATLVRLGQASVQRGGGPRHDAVSATWYAPIHPQHLTLAQARDRIDRGHRLPDALAGRAPALAAAVSYPGDLDQDAARAERERTGVRGSVTPIALAGTLVAALLVAAAGGFWAERRRREAALLVARGVSPAAIGLKAVLEALPAAALGTALGWVGARLLVTGLGPSGLLEPGANIRAGLAVLIALVVGLVALGALAGLRSPPRGHQVGKAHRRWSRAPWEVIPLGLALATYLAIQDGGAVRTTRDGVVLVSPLLVLFPLLALVGGLVVAARVSAALLPLLRRAGERLPSAPYLATRRLTGTARVTLGLVALVAVPVGLLVYAGMVTRSTSATVRAKANVYAGAPAVLVMNVPPAATPRLGGHGTVVSVFQSGRTRLGETEVLGVDPRTFARFAYSDGATLGRAPGGLVRRLVAGGDPGPPGVPAILVGCTGCGPVGQVRLRTSAVPVRVVARVPLFPGMRLLRSPVLVVDRRALAGVDHYADRQEELWTTARQLPAATRALAGQHITVAYRKTPAAFLDVVDLVPLTWTFGYLEALAGLTGSIAFAALLLYLGARQRATAASYLLSRRLGLGRSAHLRSLVDEVGALLGFGWLVGTCLGVLACLLVVPLLDLDPDFPPSSLVRVPVVLLLGSAAGVVVTVAVGVLTAQRTADRQPAADILKLNA